MINGPDVGKILNDIGITDYIEDDKRFVIQCPFHDDNSPSCGVWKDSGYFICWGCHEEGSFTDLIMEIEDVSYHEARKRVRGENYLVEMEARLRKLLKSDDEEFKYLSKKSFHITYPPVEPDTPEWEYLTGLTRKLNAESIRRFDIREGGDAKYRERVVLPIYMPDGKLLAYVGRTFTDRKPKTKKSRSPHRTFFGLFELLRDTECQESRLDIVVVEGEFDAIYLQQFGIPAISNMGTAMMTPEKIRLLRKYARRVFLCYDPDEAGERALYGFEKKSGDWKKGQFDILVRHVPTAIIELPDDTDPNDLDEEEIVDVFAEYLGDGQG